ncbi:MAG: hypothetical protein F2578_04915, partial [Actinobacteria bacterium]|nr:hypothetical protein [Actinomycetota bacterium]
MSPWLISLLALVGMAISMIGSRKTMLVMLAAILLGASLMSLRQYSLSQSELKSHFDTEWTLIAEVRSD